MPPRHATMPAGEESDSVAGRLKCLTVSCSNSILIVSTSFAVTNPFAESRTSFRLTHAANPAPAGFAFGSGANIVGSLSNRLLDLPSIDETSVTWQRALTGSLV